MKSDMIINSLRVGMEDSSRSPLQKGEDAQQHFRIHHQIPRIRHALAFLFHRNFSNPFCTRCMSNDEVPEAFRARSSSCMGVILPQL